MRLSYPEGCDVFLTVLSRSKLRLDVEEHLMNGLLWTRNIRFSFYQRYGLYRGLGARIEIKAVDAAGV